ncbi:snapalysin family zinc-dependent metalloprotease [Streptomyces meridianus]|uniref:Extracellular small neutral protease n=1 Tax=Streptomyces meridianus TaxID=2938945 RepID=A0ABT0X6A8_9ACTN|nr:snapalysin family zinc-dependent metalloprotease [Streptomyces meridianus]MCM2577860.1 snapalysin family zinc-dependent metalloprotease [Streptomyces meridianus]
MVVGAVALTGSQSAAAAAPEQPLAGRVLTYDASASAEFHDAVDDGAAVWNSSVTNVQLRPAQAGETPNIRIVADDGWPRAVTTSLGNGTVYMGREAADYNWVRIASHELGHILGLPDMKPGPCSSLMSGSSAGTACNNVYPDAYEKAWVEDNFAGGFAPSKAWERPLVFQD